MLTSGLGHHIPELCGDRSPGSQGQCTTAPPMASYTQQLIMVVEGLAQGNNGIGLQLMSPSLPLWPV